MEIGVLFDIDDLGGGSYGEAAWTIIMSEFNPVSLSNCTFFSGDTNLSGTNRPYSFCIGIDALVREKAEHFKKVLTECNPKGLLPRERRFVEGQVSHRYSLPIDGHIDAWGRLVMADTDCLWLFRVASKRGWKYLPSDDWLGKFAAEFLMHTRSNALLPWDEEFTNVARQALVEAGPKTLTALNQYLSATKDKEVKHICQEHIGNLEGIWPTKKEKVTETSPSSPGLFSRIARAFSPSTDRQMCQMELQQAKAMVEEHSWQSTLWWATKALEIDPDCHAAKKIFMTALANTAVGLVTIFAGYKDRLPTTTRILERGHMSQKDAEFVADVWIRGFYLEWLQKQYAFLLERFNKGEIRRASRLTESDLKTSRDMALALGDELLPGQKSPVQWKYIVNPDTLSFMASAITAQREALIILLQANSAFDWPNTCTRLYDLFKDLPKEQEMAASFERMVGEHLEEAEFRKYRDNFQLAFARNAAQMIWTRSLLREPA